MIRNLVFDMGNVLIHWKPYLFVEDLGVPEPEQLYITEEDTP